MYTSYYKVLKLSLTQWTPARKHYAGGTAAHDRFRGRELRQMTRRCVNQVLDVVKPALRFSGSRYFRHERMRRPIPSFEIVRFASESASPRSTMT